MRDFIDFLKAREPVTLILVAVNIIVFLVMSALGDTEDAYFMLMHGASFSPAVVLGGEYYRLFTSMFLHFGSDHLFSNMLVLIFLGDELEKITGKVRYLLIYVLGGLSGNIFSMVLDWKNESYVVSAGASGAVFAVIGALVAAVILNKGKLQGYSGSRLVMMAGLSILQGFMASGVDGWAHLGGFAFGFLIALVFGRKLRAAGREYHTEELPWNRSE